MPKISVIVPVYNTEEYLSQCLESILEQTFPDFEVIVVNDGSSDKSHDVAKSYSEKDSRILIVNQENKGLSEARNAGIDRAKGEWITFIDSDDIIAPSFLQKLLDAAQKTEASIACCSKKEFVKLSEIYSFKRAIPSPTKTPCRTTILTPIQALTNALYQNDQPDYSAWNKLYSKDLWETRRFPAGKYFEDIACIPQAFLNAKSIAFVNEPLYLYRKRTTSILSTPYTRKKAELLDIAESVCALVKDKGKKLEKAAQSNLLSASFSILMRTRDNNEFADYRMRAWNHIRNLRTGAILDTHTRMRNKIAALISYAGKRVLNLALRRFG